ncbi:MAG: DUF3850 domain-containing protein [Verrucomicrobia bacterium]|nr:DUF3850 domain-containing protein [Verrucomicrobiota bacterium]
MEIRQKPQGLHSYGKSAGQIFFIGRQAVTREPRANITNTENMETTPKIKHAAGSRRSPASCSGSLPESNLGCQHLKTWPKYFAAVERGTKTFEIRQNDRPFMIGQRLILHEYDPEEEKFTGRTVERRITYMTDWEQKPGFVVMAIQPLCQNEPRTPTR